MKCPVYVLWQISQLKKENSGVFFKIIVQVLIFIKIGLKLWSGYPKGFRSRCNIIVILGCAALKVPKVVCVSYLIVKSILFSKILRFLRIQRIAEAMMRLNLRRLF